VLKRGWLWSPRFIKDSAAAVAFQEALPTLDRDEGNEEKAYVMVQPLEPCRGQTTVGTDPRLVIHLRFSGLYSTDKDEGTSPPEFLAAITRPPK